MVGKSQNVWVVHGTIEDQPVLLIFQNRQEAMQRLIDIRNSPCADRLAVAVLGGVEDGAVWVEETLVLGWVQDLVQP